MTDVSQQERPTTCECGGRLIYSEGPAGYVSVACESCTPTVTIRPANTDPMTDTTEEAEMSEGTLVYVVTHGEYSDYRIAAIFSTRQRAEAFVEEFNAAGEGRYGYVAGIEEWTMDEPRESLPPAFVVEVDVDGNVLRSKNNPSETPDRPPTVLPHRYVDGARVDSPAFRGYGVTEEHARRSAEELRRQHVAVHGKRYEP